MLKKYIASLGYFACLGGGDVFGRVQSRSDFATRRILSRLALAHFDTTKVDEFGPQEWIALYEQIML